MSEFSISGSYTFVSKSGNDANSGDDPDNPKLTIVSAITGGTYGGIVLGSGVYEEDSADGVSLLGHGLYGDGIVILRGDLTNYLTSAWSNTSGRLEDLIIIDFLEVFEGGFSGNSYARITRCIFINTSVDLRDSGAGGWLEDSRFVSSSIPIALGPIYGCLFINTILDENGDAVDYIRSCHFDSESSLILNAGGQNRVSYCNIQCSIEVDGTTYSSLSEARAALGGFVGCIDEDPLFIGSPKERYEFIVRPNSPLVNAGFNGVNIGSVKTGSVQNFQSLQWGLSPASNTNTQFNASKALEISGGATTGTRESKEIDEGQTIKNPVLRLNGLSDFLNNVPDSNNALVNPNHLCVDVSYAGLDKVYTAFKPFQLNRVMRLDNTGKSNGEAGFDWGNLVDIEFRYWKIRVTIRNNYNIA